MSIHSNLRAAVRSLRKSRQPCCFLSLSSRPYRLSSSCITRQGNLRHYTTTSRPENRLFQRGPGWLWIRPHISGETSSKVHCTRTAMLYEEKDKLCLLVQSITHLSKRMCIPLDIMRIKNVDSSLRNFHLQDKYLGLNWPVPPTDGTSFETDIHGSPHLAHVLKQSREELWSPRPTHQRHDDSSFYEGRR